MEFLLESHGPSRGSTSVYTGHDFLKALQKHQNAVFIVDEADLFIDKHIAYFNQDGINGLAAL